MIISLGCCIRFSQLNKAKAEVSDGNYGKIDEVDEEIGNAYSSDVSHEKEAKNVN